MLKSHQHNNSKSKTNIIYYCYFHIWFFFMFAVFTVFSCNFDVNGVLITPIKKPPLFKSCFVFLLTLPSRGYCFPCHTLHCQFLPPSFHNHGTAMAVFKGVWTQEFWRCVGAEFFAMLLFVLPSLGSTISWSAVEDDPCSLNVLLISLCFGLSIATMVQCFSHISGAHINPALTMAMVVTRRLSLAKAFFYLLAHCLGAIVGAAILFGITPASFRGSMGVTTVCHVFLLNTNLQSTVHFILIDVWFTFVRHRNLESQIKNQTSYV